MAFHGLNGRAHRNGPENIDRKSREFWRELARLVTFFDLCSPYIFLGSEIGEFFREWRARQDSNLRPPA